MLSGLRAGGSPQHRAARRVQSGETERAKRLGVRPPAQPRSVQLHERVPAIAAILRT